MMDKSWILVISILTINVAAIATDSEEVVVTATNDASFVLEGE